MNPKLHIYEYRDYLADRYGKVLHRIPIDVGGSCPHRGEDNSGGCIFCPPDGARAIQLQNIKDVKEQIRTGVRFAKKRYKATGFMAYLQTFTNTYGSIRKLQTLVEEILGEEQFTAITFGTRPDCISKEVVDYLKELQQQLDVWVELGIQSCNDATLKRINRGHLWRHSEQAIMRLHSAGISIGAHVILGLPGESVQDYLHTITTLTAQPINAIKLHNLHVIKTTGLAEQFKRKPFPVLGERDYCEVLLALLPYIPEQLPIMRLTTDTAPDKLLAPNWSMSKGQFRKFIFSQMRARAITQGCALREKNPKFSGNQSNFVPAPVKTEDGSLTFYNTQVKEHYHTLSGARSEAERKYSNPAEINQLLTSRKIHLLDVCFGLGYNSLVACDNAIRLGAELDIIGLEIDPGVVRAAADNMKEQETAFNWKDCLQDIATKGFWQNQGCTIQLIWGDARYSATTPSVRPASFDLIWLDAFSTQKNSELWTVDFFRNLFQLLNKAGTLFTYCAAIPVRSGLLEAGFYVGETEPFGRQRGGTVASPDKTKITRPLPEKDIQLIKSTKGIPYRDPEGTRTNKEILRAREFEILRYKEQHGEKRST